jgi:hypothetical protein
VRIPFRRSRSLPPQRGRVDAMRVTLADVDLDAARLIEGACAYYHGLPLEACPWPRESDRPELFLSWRRGWLDAVGWADMWAEEDAKRWLLPTQPQTL